MDTKTFVEKRLAAHKAGTVDVANDPLVKAALDARKREPVTVHPEEVALYVLPEGWSRKKQAT